MRRFTTAAARLAVTRQPRWVVTKVKTVTATAPAASPAASKNPAPQTAVTITSAGTTNTGNTGSTTNTGNTARTGNGFTPSLNGSAGIQLRSVPSLAHDNEPDATHLLASQPAADIKATETLDEDWATSFQGLGSAPFEPRVIDILMAPVVPEDVEVTPDGLIYLPEIKYRRILNRAFGPGGWGIAPRTKTLVTKRQVTREYGLVCLGRLVSVSRGEMDFFNPEGVTTAMEGCKSNALMRCCKDLGIASELWDPSFIRSFKSKYCDSKYFEKKKRFVWKRKDRQWEYPYV